MIRIWDSVARNRISIHMLKLELKLNKIMNNQVSSFFNLYAMIEKVTLPFHLCREFQYCLA